MHDTNAKGLFEEVSRPFSHGCMRVRDPRRMAEILLGEDKGWDAARIADLIANGPENNEVLIDRKIGVHVTYFTAWVDDKNETQIARDVYGHEQRISQALQGRWSQIAKGPNHLAPVRSRKRLLRLRQLQERRRLHQLGARRLLGRRHPRRFPASRHGLSGRPCPDLAPTRPPSAPIQWLPIVKGWLLTLRERECRSHTGMPEGASRRARRDRSGHGVARWYCVKRLSSAAWPLRYWA